MWAEQIASLANPDATDEVNRSPEEHYFLQLLLAYRGYLPADAKIDGSYGAGTRAAIVAIQKKAQVP